MGILTSLFSGGIVKSIENVALEAIETNIEKAEASTILVKALDPNGAMRRQISQTVSQLYVLYMLIMFVLIVLQSFQVGDVVGVEKSLVNLKELFEPITWAFITIVGTSFGVNGMNSFKGK